MAISEKYRKLFQPGTIGNLRLKNRLIMAPLGIVGLVEIDGSLSQRAIDFYEERARGGIGLVVTGSAFTSAKFDPFWIDGRYFPHHRVDSSVVIPRLNQLAERIHDYDCKLAVQMTPGYGRVVKPAYIQKGQPPAASALSCFWNSDWMTRPFATEEVEELAASFGPAARLARTAGVDAINLHFHEGYLGDQFMTSLWNKRADKYGGATVRQRMTFALEVFDSIQRSTQGEMPIIFRFGLTHKLPGGRTEEEGLEICQIAEDAGVAALELDSGAYENWYWPHPPVYQPPACNLDMAVKAKQVVKSIPIIAVGKLGYPDIATRVIEEGKADFVTIGRALLADPQWPNKTREGRVDEIRPCIGCQECQARVKRPSITCALNPACGDERALSLTPAEKKKKVIVVGGGPAGMEAARVAKLRGHDVVLHEKSTSLGGDLIAASVPDFKNDVRLLLNWYRDQLKRLSVAVMLNSEVTPENILKVNPDVVILATGAASKIPPIPGIESPNVSTAIDVFTGKRDTGKRVVIIGGGVVGCELAVYLARKGKEVTVVEVLQEILTDAKHTHAARQMLMAMLAESKTQVYTSAEGKKITDSLVTVASQGKPDMDLKADSVVIAAGFTSRDSGQWEKLAESVDEVYSIGSCVSPGRVIDAVWQGYAKARLI